MIEKNNKRNTDRVRCLFFMFVIYPINNLLSSFFEYYNVASPNILIILYMLVMIYGIIIILKYSFTIKDVFVIMIIYVGYFILYFISTDVARVEMQSVYMRLMYLYFTPLSVIIVSHIEDFSELFSKKYVIISDIFVILTVISKVFLRDNTDYMIFSYDLLPFWALIVVVAIYFREKIQWIFSIIILIEALVFGCRGVLIWILTCGSLVYAIVLFYQRNTKKIINKILRFPFFIMTALIAIVEFLPKLLQSKYAASSYILIRLTMGSLSESSARTEILKLCIDEIKKMGFNINGLFYDRSFLPHGMYAHNFIIEIILSFGWFLGILFLIFIVKKISGAFFKQTLDGKIIWVYFLTVLFLRYFISGSIFGEGKFGIFIAVMIALNKYNQRSQLLALIKFGQRGD